MLITADSLWFWLWVAVSGMTLIFPGSVVPQTHQKGVVIDTGKHDTVATRTPRQPSSTLAADSAWQRLMAIRNFDTYPIGDAREAEQAAWMDTVGRRFRKEGLLFFDAFPNDRRRWLWLIGTINTQPKYYADFAQVGRSWRAGTPWLAQIDTIAKACADSIWSQRYPEIRAAFMASSQVTPEQRLGLLFNELVSDLSQMTRTIQRGEKVKNIRSLQARVLDYALRPGFDKYPGGPEKLAHFFTQPAVVAYDSVSLFTFLAAAKTSENAKLRGWARTEEELRLLNKPFVLRGENLTGDTVDIVRYRGKVVFVDLWGTSCGACIAAFPRLKDLYAKYQPRGVEFIGVAVDYPEQKQQVKHLLSTYMLPWPQIFAGEQVDTFMSQYGVQGLPKYFIVDKTGRLVSSGFFNHGEIENAIIRALAQK